MDSVAESRLEYKLKATQHQARRLFSYDTRYFQTWDMNLTLPNFYAWYEGHVGGVL